MMVSWYFTSKPGMKSLFKCEVASGKNGPDSNTKLLPGPFSFSFIYAILLCLSYAIPKPFRRTFTKQIQKKHCKYSVFGTRFPTICCFGYPPLQIPRKFTRDPAPVSKRKDARDLTHPSQVLHLGARSFRQQYNHTFWQGLLFNGRKHSFCFFRCLD